MKKEKIFLKYLFHFPLNKQNFLSFFFFFFFGGGGGSYSSNNNNNNKNYNYDYIIIHSNALKYSAFLFSFCLLYCNKAPFNMKKKPVYNLLYLNGEDIDISTNQDTV